MSYLRKSVSGEEDIVLGAGTAEIGKLAAGVASIGALSGISNPTATWYVTATGDDQETITATKAAGATGVVHYVCGILVSADFGHDVSDGMDVKIIYSGMSTMLLQFRINGSSQKEYEQSGDPTVITFAHPLAIPSAQLVSLVVDGCNSIDAEKIDANMWGFSVNSAGVAI